VSGVSRSYKLDGRSRMELSITEIGSARELKEGFLQIWRERSGGECNGLIRHESK
jgi:hypothetical protein